MHSTTTRLRRFGLALFSVLISATSLASPVAARDAVDPSTLNPPPPDYINAQCAWAGDQVICAYAYSIKVTYAPTGIICDGGEMIETSDRSVAGQRFYNADLNLTERRFREWIDGRLYVAETGASVRWTGTDNGIQVLSVPGDRSTGVLTSSGAGIHLYLNDGRSISLAGRATENFDTGEYHAVGANTSYDLCDALQ